MDITTSSVSIIILFYEGFKYGMVRNSEMMLRQTLNYFLQNSVMMCIVIYYKNLTFCLSAYVAP
jgi:hypothetical protein